MGKIIRISCDFCDKETDDWCSEKGWIRMNGGPLHAVRITVSVGRSETGVPVTGYTSRKALDFCSAGCLTSYIKNLKVR
jgi:hypothetical protein